MATHDYVIANGTGGAVRSDLNNALAAIVSNNSSASAPATTYAYQWWADTNDNVLKIRNAANNAWITLQQLDGTLLMEDGTEGAPGLALRDDTDTGIFSPGANVLGISSGGNERIRFGNAEVVVNDGSDDVDFRVESDSNANMLFVNGGTNRVGVGTATPQALLHVSGTTHIGATNTENAALEIGAGATGNRNAIFDLIGDTTYTDYGLRIIRNNGGANTTSVLAHRGTGGLQINAQDAGNIQLHTNNTERLRVTSGGNVGIGTTSPNSRLEVKTPSGTDCQVRINEGGTTNPFIIEQTSSESRVQVKASQPLVLGAQDTSGSSQPIIFKTRNNERARIDSSGNVGIGTNAPNEKLHVAGNAQIGAATGSAFIKLGKGATENRYAYLDLVGDTTYSDFGLRIIRNNGGANTTSVLDHRGTGAFEMKTREAAPLVFTTNNSERFRITSDGKVGIGTTSASAKFDVSGDALFGNKASGNSEGGQITLRAKNGSTSIAHFDVDGSDDVRLFTTTNNTNFRIGQLSGTGGSLFFFAGGSERFRTTSAGNILIHQATENQPGAGNTTLGSSFTFTSGEGTSFFVSRSNNVCAHFNRAQDGTIVSFASAGTSEGSISISGSTTSYNETSDYRLKENVVDIADGITRVKQLQPKRFNFITHPEKTVDGFLAHEAQTVVPESVTGTHNEVDDDGNAVMQGIDKSKLVPLLTAALQEAIAKIETLEAKVAALEAG